MHVKLLGQLNNKSMLWSSVISESASLGQLLYFGDVRCIPSAAIWDEIENGSQCRDTDIIGCCHGGGKLRYLAKPLSLVLRDWLSC